MSTKSSPSSIKEVDRDPDLFVWFLTFVVGGLAIWSFFVNPGLQKPIIAVVFFSLVVLHILLHWVLGVIVTQPKKLIWYIIAQGTMAFIISWMAGQVGIIFGLYMGLLGEAVGLFGLNRRGLLSAIFYLSLATVNATQIMDLIAVGWMLLGIVPMVFFVVAYVTLYMRQNDAREQAQTLLAELEVANRQLSEYAAQVEDLTLVNERQRMARELHDTLSQGLAGLILQLEAADAYLTKERPERAHKIVQDAMGQARETLSNARRAIGDLRSSVDGFDGLEQALGAEVKRFEQATGLPCELDVQFNGQLSESIIETSLRIVSEALTNVARHAQASRAWVQVKEISEQVFLEIRDDGQGFDSKTIQTGHFGLLGMRERVRLVGGTIDMTSGAGSGTTIKVCLPLVEVSHE